MAFVPGRPSRALPQPGPQSAQRICPASHHRICKSICSASNDSPTVLDGDKSTNVNGHQLPTPLLDAVRRRGDALREAPFHVPGHKRGAGAPSGLLQLARPPNGSVLQYDLTEIAGLDYLSSPSGVIAQAQHLAAQAFGADATWFLVNGCSVGIHASVVAVTAGYGGGGNGSSGGGGRPVLLVARNCHLSAFSAMVIAGCEPCWLQPEIDPWFGVAHCVTPGAVRTALEDAAVQGRSVVGVLIVSPTYYGAVADVKGIAAACHDHDVPLIVDEAHGGHFAFLPGSERHNATQRQTETQTQTSAKATAQTQMEHQFQSHVHSAAQQNGVSPSSAKGAGAVVSPPPPSALSCGADIVIQSTHKVLGALTQAAMLHTRGKRVDPVRISRALQTLQSSSPSYLLMASLDAARAQAAAGGTYDQPLTAAQLIRDTVRRCRRVCLLDEYTASSRSPVHCFDPLRLTLHVGLLGLGGGGFEAAEWLEQRHGVVSEVATAKTVVLALGPGSTLQHAAIAAEAILELDTIQGARTTHDGLRPAATGKLAVDADRCCSTTPAPATVTAGPATAVPAGPEVVMTPREAFFAASTSLSADLAVGHVSAELLCPYPPGVPVLFPGERITPAALATLRATLAAGGAVTGARDGSLGTLEVVVVSGG